MFKPDFALFKESFISKLKDKDLFSMVNLLEILLRYHAPKLKDTSPEAQYVLLDELMNSRPLYAAFVMLLNHGFLSVRKCAVDSVTLLHSVNPLVANGLVRAMYSYLLQVRVQYITHVVQISQAPSSDSTPSNHILSFTLVVITSSSLSPALIPAILLLTHHPLTCTLFGPPHSPSAPPSLWKQALKRIDKDIIQLLTSNADVICNYLLSTEGMQHQVD